MLRQNNMKTLLSFSHFELLQENKRYEHINFIPYKVVSNKAKKGLKYVKEHNIPVSKTMKVIAKKLSRRDKMSPLLIKRMCGFFDRNKHRTLTKKYKREPWKDHDYVKFLLLGGDNGRMWAERIKTQLVKADKKK